MTLAKEYERMYIRQEDRMLNGLFDIDNRLVENCQ